MTLETNEQAAPENDIQEESAALSAGYNKIAEKVVTDKPVEVKTADPWDGVPDVVRKALDGISGKLGAIDTLSRDIKTNTGRVAAIQSAMDAAKSAVKAVEIAPTQTQIADAVKTSEKWVALKEDFPEWSDAMDERLTNERNEILKHIPKVDVDAIKRDVGEGFNDTIKRAGIETGNRARELARLDRKYDTWEQDVYEPDGVTYTPDYASWEEKQAPDIRALKESPNARDAMKVLDLYYDHRKAVERKDKNKARLATSVTPQQATGGGPSILPDEAGLAVGYSRMARRS